MSLRRLDYGNTEKYTNKVTGMSELSCDAWGRQKIVQDYSLFHGMFTFDIPPNIWLKYIDGVEILDINDTVNFYSENCKGIINGNGSSAYLMSKRHPRYQPNRGHLYSSSMILPNPNDVGTRRFGLFNSQFGIFFELTDGVLYAVTRNTVDGVTNDDKVALDIAIDLSKGNIYDIQFQWRGVGNIKFYIGDDVSGYSRLVYEFKNLNMNTELTIGNPAMPIGFEAIGNVQIECGCCDVTSEGGNRESRFYTTVDSGEISTDTQELPVLLFKIPNTYNGLMNTRDCILTRISGYANENSLMRVYYTRDATAFTATFQPLRKGFQEYALDGNITNVDYNKLIKLATRRIPINGNIEIENPDKINGDFALIHGDYILITIQAKNNTESGVFLEYSQEV